MSDLSTTRNSPVVDYTSVDFDGMKADLITYAQANYADRWTDFNDDQFAVVMVDILSYLHDLLHYQLNAILRETFAATVLRRQNLIHIGKIYDYEPTPPKSSYVDLKMTLDPSGTYPFPISKDDQFSNGNSEGDEVFFSPVSDTTVLAYAPGGITVSCVEGERWSNQLIGVSNGNPNQRWQFPQDSVVVDSISISVSAATWTKANKNNFVYSRSTDTHFRVVYDDEGHVFALFGDGVYGAVPPNSAQIRSTFRVGGGARGNLNVGTVETIVSAHPSIISVTNPERASGGENVQSLKVARNALPASLKTLDRAVTTQDYADIAVTVSGVAKARSAPGLPPGSRTIKVIIAPSGGGAPTASLKSNALATFKIKKMVTNRVRMYGPIYKPMRLHILLHVNPSYRAADVNQAVRQGIVNVAGTGLLDFGQLDFAGVGKDTSGNPEMLLAQTRLQGHFDRLATIGLDRAEVQRLDVIPQARARDEGNAGNGIISDSSIMLSGKQRRREFYVRLTSATTYQVYERIIGFVSGMTDSVLSDDTKIFSEEGIVSFAGYKLVPYRGSSTTLDVAGASDQDITISSASSLFTLTEVGAEYYLYNPTPVSVAVGSEFTSVDGTVKFTLTAGPTPFISSDSFTLDIFPEISDIRMRDDEYPQLSEANFVSRTSGGARV